MKKHWSLKKMILWCIAVFVCYHIVFGGARILIDFKYPNGWYDNTVVAFGEKLRIFIFMNKESKVWEMVDTIPGEENIKYTPLDSNVYSFDEQMGWFYQYKTFYVYGRDGFWIIQADPFHITLLRNLHIPETDARKLDKTIAKYKPYGDQFTVIQSESDLNKQEREEFAKLKEKAKPRIEELKQLGLYP